jgi:hypothetical protein
MAQIRQEINITDTSYSDSTGGTDSSEIILLDTTQYNGTVSYYFEVDARVIDISKNVTLRRKGTSTDDATVSVTATSNSLVRSTAFTPPAGQTEYIIHLVGTIGHSVTVKAARIIVIQEATTLTSTETQIEIGNASNTTATVDTALTNPKYWQYTAANWDGTKTVYFESTFLSGTSKSAATMTLQTSTDILAPSWSNVASSAVTTTSTTAARVRSGAITLVDGNWYRAVMKAGNSKSGITTYNAKIIVDQYGASTTDTYYFDAHTAGPTDSSAVWTDDANAFDGNTVTSASTTTAGTFNTNLLAGTGTTAPTSGNTILLVEYRAWRVSTGGGSQLIDVYDGGTRILTGDSTEGQPTAYRTLTPASGLWTWSKINALEIRCYMLSGGGTGRVFRGEVRVTTPDGTTPITKLEPQYLLANTLFAAGTGLQTFLTNWDSTEWSGVTNTYTFQAEAADNSTSDIELWAADGSGSALATVTNADNAGQATATLGTSKNLDVKATTNAGDVAAARILVATVVSSAATVTHLLSSTGVGR